MTRSTRQRRIISILQITQPGEGTKGGGEERGGGGGLRVSCAPYGVDRP